MAKYTPPAAARVTVQVDGIAVEVPANYNVIQACKAVGSYVPHYCWHPSLSVPGNCRLCLVKVEGVPKLVAGCHTPVRDGLKITTKDAEVEDSRSGMMEFLLANHPLDCPQCDRGGECQLQRYSMDYGVGETRFAPNDKRRFPKPQFDPLIDLERNRCILCTRCTRFTDEIAGEHVMGVFGRGDGCYIGTFGDGPVSNIFSGNVIDICPVGCLTNKPYRFRARPWELRQVASICTGCSTGCHVTYWMRAGQVMRTTPPAALSEQFAKYTLDADTVDFICNQGRFGNDYGRHAERVRRVVVRKPGEGRRAAETPLAGTGAGAGTTPAGWDEAIATTASKLKEAAARGRAAVLLSPRLTNEEYLAAAHLAKEALGTRHVDWRTRLATAEAAAALSEALALADGSIDAVGQYGAVVVVGGAPQQTSPIAALDLREAARRGQTTLFVAGSRLEPFFTAVARGSFVVAAGAEAAWIEWLASGAEGDAPAAAPGGDLGAASGALRAALAGDKPLLLVYDPTAQHGLFAGPIVGAVKAAAARLGARLHTLPLLRERNGRGAFLAGAQPDRALGERAGGEGGWSAPEILARAAAGEIDALLVVGAGDALDPHPFPELVRRALDKVPFVAATELLDGPIARRADVVLPAANFYEKNGTMLNAEGRVGRLAAAEQPEEPARAEFDILLALAAKAGTPAPFATPEAAFARLREAMAARDGVATAPARALEARVVDAATNFAPRGKAPAEHTFLRRREAANGFRPAARDRVAADGQGPVLLWTDHLQGRDHCGSRAEQADILTPPRTLELHPATAASLGVAHRDEADLVVGARTVRVRVVVRPEMAEGAGFVFANVVGLDGLAADGLLPRFSLRRAGA